jgi:hypothetical protein
MAKTKLVFDATSDFDNVGAWIRAGSDGDKIGSQTYNSEEWLNVAAVLTDSSGAEVGTGANPLSVNIENTLGIDVDLIHTEDSVRLGDGTSFFTSTSENGDIALDVHISNTSIAVSATDLDIRDLAFATDKVDVSGSSVSISGTVAVTQSTSPWVVSATDLDIRDLSAATDSVSSWLKDGAGNSINSTSGAINTFITNSNFSVDDTANTNSAFSAVSIGTTAGGVDLVASDLAARKHLFVYNNGSKSIYLGKSGVTISTGFPIDPGSYIGLRAGAAQNLFAIAQSGSQDVRVMELS